MEISAGEAGVSAPSAVPGGEISTASEGERARSFMSCVGRDLQ